MLTFVDSKATSGTERVRVTEHFLKLLALLRYAFFISSQIAKGLTLKMV